MLDTLRPKCNNKIMEQTVEINSAAVREAVESLYLQLGIVDGEYERTRAATLTHNEHGYSLHTRTRRPTPCGDVETVERNWSSPLLAEAFVLEARESHRSQAETERCAAFLRMAE